MRQTPVAAAAFLLALVLAGCSVGGGQPSPSGTPDSSPSATASGLSATEIEARIVTGAPPEDLIWGWVEGIPSDWTEVEAGQGELQWQVGDSQCAVLLSQPAGIEPDISPEDVAHHHATATLEGAGVEPVLEPATFQMFPAEVNADVQIEIGFTEIHFSDPEGRIEGDSYAYRAGEFALVALAACGEGDYAEHSAEILGAIHGLAATITY